MFYFDGAMNPAGRGIGAVLVSPDDVRMPVTFKLKFKCSNNAAEYEACIAGLRAARELGIKELEVYGDSLLIISQVRKNWKVRDQKLLPFHKCLTELVEKFDRVTFTHLFRDRNNFAPGFFDRNTGRLDSRTHRGWTEE